MHVERGALSDLTNSQKGGKSIAILKSLKRKRRRGEIVVLDFLPDDTRPGGHSEKDNPP